MIAWDDREAVLVWGKEPPPRRQARRVSEGPTYERIHRRLRRERGPARAYRCVNCGDHAEQWSYDGLDPDEQTECIRGKALAFSVDLGHYRPRCVGCHLKYDRFGKDDKDDKWVSRASQASFPHLIQFD